MCLCFRETLSYAKPSMLDRNIKYKLTNKKVEQKNSRKAENTGLNENNINEYKTVTALPVMLLDSNHESLEVMDINNEYSC